MARIDACIRGEGEVPMEVLLTACALRHGEARVPPGAFREESVTSIAGDAQDPAILGQIGEFLEVCHLRAELGPTAVINWLNKDFEMGRPYDILVEYPITP